LVFCKGHDLTLIQLPIRKTFTRTSVISRNNLGKPF